MKKNRLFMIGVISACLLGLCACGGSSKTGNEGTEEKEASAVNTESPEKEDAEDREKEKDTESPVVTFARQYLDIDAYTENPDMRENKIPGIIDEMTVGNETLKVGMSYKDVVALGFEPVSSDFASSKISGNLASVGKFYTKEKTTLNLGFIGEDGDTISEGTLYSMRVGKDDENPSAGSVGGIVCGDATIEDVLETFQNPRYIDTVLYDGGEKLAMEYSMEGRSVYIRTTIDPGTGKVFALSIEGFVD